MPRLRLLAAVLAGAALLAACGTNSAAGGDGRITLTVSLFGNFGYKDLYTQYEKDHPNIKIQERTAAYNDHHRDLATHLPPAPGPATSRASTPASSPRCASAATTSSTWAPTASPSTSTGSGRRR